MRMTAVVVVAAGVLVGAAPAWPAPGDSATAVLSSSVAGARPVALTLRLGYPMQCGSPGAGPVTISLPAAMTVPAQVAQAAVLVDGKRAYSVGRSGRKILVGLAPQPGIMCDVIAPGTLTIRLTAAARLGNPAAVGTYVVRAVVGSRAFVAKLVIYSH